MKILFVVNISKKLEFHRSSNSNMKSQARHCQHRGHSEGYSLISTQWSVLSTLRPVRRPSVRPSVRPVPSTERLRRTLRRHLPRNCMYSWFFRTDYGRMTAFITVLTEFAGHLKKTYENCFLKLFKFHTFGFRLKFLIKQQLNDCQFM